MKKQLLFPLLAALALPLNARNDLYTKAIHFFCARRILQQQSVAPAKLYLRLTDHGKSLLNAHYLRFGKTVIGFLDKLNEQLSGYPVRWQNNRLGIGFD